MSYREAQEDGVTIRRSGNGSTVYYPPCHICGKPTFSQSYMRNRKYTCGACKAAASIRKTARGPHSSSEFLRVPLDAHLKM